jgi:predicted MFS family arabinose efflux permease
MSEPLNSAPEILRRESASMRIAATLIVVVGMDTFIVQPGFVQGLVEKGGFGDKQAGYIAAAEMFGIAATTVAMVWLATRARWRTLVALALLLDAAGNLLCTRAVSFNEFVAVRFTIGLTSGVLISIGYAVIGRTTNPDRNFGLLIVWVLTYGALGVFALPSAFSVLGLHGVLVALALLAASGLWVVRYLPDTVATAQSAGAAKHTGSLLSAAMLLGAVLCFFLAQGTVWSYLFLIGIASGGGEQAVANGLTVAQFLGIVGAFAAAMWGPRLRHSTSLIGGISAGVLPMFFFLGAKGAVIYGAAVSIFNCAANYVTPLLMAVVARGDRSGRLIVYAVALQMLGLAIGPALGAAAISPGDYRQAILISMGLCVGCLLLILPPVIGQSRGMTSVSPA